MKKWSFEEALVELQNMEEALAPHYHVGLTGSVLQTGDGKDLDVIVYPHTSTRFDMDEVRQALEDAGYRLLVPRETVVQHWRKAGSNDNKYVEVWAAGSRRIDIFYWKDFS